MMGLHSMFLAVLWARTARGDESSLLFLVCYRSK